MSEERKLAWWGRFRPGDVDVFAKQTLDCVAKNQSIIVLPKHNRAVVALFRTLPWLEEKIAGKLYDKTLAEFPEMKTAAERAPRSQGVATDDPFLSRAGATVASEAK